MAVIPSCGEQGSHTSEVGPFFRLLKKAMFAGAFRAPDDAGRRSGSVKASMGEMAETRVSKSVIALVERETIPFMSSAKLPMDLAGCL